MRDGQIVVRDLMNLSISVDHRIVDGYDGAMFLQDVKTLLEDPTMMFMEMVLTRMSGPAGPARSRARKSRDRTERLALALR